jgi:hypothetical protein
MKKRLFVSSILTMVMIFTVVGPSYSQTIYGCVSKSGALRIVSGAGQCKKTETSVSWGQNGTPGPQGPQGAQGPQGPKGDPTYVRTVLVSPVGTTTQNGTALLNALAGITTASSTNPYLLKIEPGIYDLGTSSFQMKAHVDVEGSGENTTIITGHIDYIVSGVVQGASNAEIRFLSVQQTGGVHGGYAISNNGESPRITNVTASASGAASNSGVINFSSSPTMTNVTASASGGTNNWGVFSTGGGTIMINNSVIIGSTNTIFNDTNTTTRVGNSKLNGGPVSNAANAGALTCAGVYDENYTFYASTCP